MLLVILWIVWILILFSQLFYFSFMEGRKMFWSCALLNLILTDRAGLFEAPEMWYEPWRKVPQDDSIYGYKAKRIRKSNIFLENRASTPLGMFYQERDTEVKSNPSALFGIIAVFDFGLFIWQRIYGDSGEGPAKISKSDVRNGD